MRRRTPILVLLAVLVATPLAVAQTTGTTTSIGSAEPTCQPDALGQSRSLLHETYRLKRWQHKHPLSDAARKRLDILTVCLTPKEKKNVADYKNKVKPLFFLYRKYRAVAEIRCQEGAWGYYAVPCYIISCESGFSWSAYNPSGAAGPYQIMVGRVWPVNSRRDQVQHHIRADEIWREQGPGAWVCA